MPLFRKHRGGLHESLSTTVIVKTIDELRNRIYEDWKMWEDALRKDGERFSKDIFDIKIENYYFDSRTGWHTQLVSADLEVKGDFMMIGYLSEPF